MCTNLSEDGAVQWSTWPRFVLVDTILTKPTQKCQSSQAKLVCALVGRSLSAEPMSPPGQDTL